MVSRSLHKEYERAVEGLDAFYSTREHCYLCVDCARRRMFHNSRTRLIAIGNGHDLSFKDAYGFDYDLLHTDSVQYATDGGWFDDGLYCGACNAEIHPPVEDEDD